MEYTDENIEPHPEASEASPGTVVTPAHVEPKPPHETPEKANALLGCHVA